MVTQLVSEMDQKNQAIVRELEVPESPVVKDLSEHSFKDSMFRSLQQTIRVKKTVKQNK